MILKDKVILVAGAAGRIGRISVIEMLKNGAFVVAADNSAEAIERLSQEIGSNDRIKYITLDITDKASISTAFDSSIRWFGKIDGAVNTSYPRSVNFGRDFLDVTFEDFSNNVSMHLGGYFLYMQKCVQYALSTKVSFSLVNLSSIYGVIAPRFEIYSGTGMNMAVEYAAIKSALQHMTHFVSAYAKGSELRVNCVSPGGIYDGQDSKFVKSYNSYCRRKGMLDPKDISGTIIFLLSDLSENICGQNIIVDDGFHL